MRGRRSIALGAAALTLVAAAPATAKTAFHGIHAHRGGPLENGIANYPENSLEAFRNTHENVGTDVVELDAKLTADNVPVIMHDATLDRTTNCTGQVRQKTAADLAANCRIDTVGTGDKLMQVSALTTVPPLTEVLAWAKASKVKLNLEIKNQPPDPDFDPTPGFAQTVLNAVEQSGIDKKTVLIQSFLPPNLDQAKARGFSTSLLLLQQASNQQGIDLAKQNGYSVVSPGWPTAEDPKTFVTSAHAAGLPVIPYTIDSKAEIERALDAGVDGVITNEAVIGVQTLYGRQCTTAKARERRLKKLYAKRKAAYRARRTAGRRKAVLSARKAYNSSRRARATSCARARA